jgi:tetratricopeptide (TPR) repeat protein
VINVNLANLMANSGDQQGARDQLQRVLAITPHDASLLRGLSGLELGERHYAEALRTAEKALGTDPDGPANIQALLRILLAIEDYDAAATLAQRLPEQSQDRAIVLQEISFRQGSTELVPEMAERITAIARRAYSASDSGILTLGGMVQMRAGHAALAAEWLGQAAGTPELLEGNPELMDTASLLVFAHEALAEKEPVERWREPLLKVAKRAMQRPGNLVQNRIIEAMMGMHGDDRKTAVAALKQAYDAGWRDRWMLLYDPRLAPLQSNADIQAMQQRMAEEFAAARASAPRALGD